MAIMMPERKQSLFSKIAAPVGSMVGAGVGSIVEPGAGTAIGSALGGAAGNAAAGIANKDAGTAIGGIASGVQGAAGASQSEAMQRRLDTQNKLLSDAIDAVPKTGAPADMQSAMQRKLMIAAMNGQGVA